MTLKKDPKKSLGLVSMPDNTFEYDLAISDKFQAFSTELLRLSLLAIAAIGFLLKEILLRESEQADKLRHDADLKNGMIIALIFLALSAVLALMHRYTGPNSVSYHLASMRSRLLLQEELEKGIKKDEEKEEMEEKEQERKKKETTGRDLYFKLSKYMLAFSAIFLVFGAVSVIALFIRVL